MEARSKRYLSWEESNNNIGVNNNARGPKWQVATKKTKPTIKRIYSLFNNNTRRPNTNVRGPTSNAKGPEQKQCKMI
jgi:hypothetical protein